MVDYENIDDLNLTMSHSILRQYLIIICNDWTLNGLSSTIRISLQQDSLGSVLLSELEKLC